MKYHCSWCDYIYDELKWDEDLWIQKNTFFDSLWNDFFCPFCDTHKDDFVVFEEEINYPLDSNNLTHIEDIHFPEYEIVWDELFLNISSESHPQNEDHFIYKIRLYDDAWDEIEKYNFSYNSIVKIKFDMSYLDTFEIRVYCSLEWVFSTWIITR